MIDHNTTTDTDASKSVTKLFEKFTADLYVLAEIGLDHLEEKEVATKPEEILQTLKRMDTMLKYLPKDIKDLPLEIDEEDFEEKKMRYSQLKIRFNSGDLSIYLPKSKFFSNPSEHQPLTQPKISPLRQELVHGKK